MYLFELFDAGKEGMLSQLAQHVMDHITPMVAHDVEFVAVQDIQDNLTNARTGLVIDRALVMQILDPNKIKLIKKVEGDKVYLTTDRPSEVNKTEDDKLRDQDKVKKKAQKAAKKRLKDK